MVYKIACLIIVSMTLFAVSGAMADSEKEKVAETVTLKWLKLIDEGRYADSWNETAPLFKNSVKKDQWEQSLQTVREPLGKLIYREVKSKAHKTSLPGAPDGQYVIIQFEASFENKKSAIETVTPMLDKDGNWRVSGYYIN
ncbi:MAG: hypothetical protein CVU69_10810 [Deltaproteobacteria bacterium HGW-Deltaproteobacteria-4]|nr:MAG: hypothetical protein CVU69_10810 [Deltaproteobacteria bacterium HGW-Deltaproteobacteria-4]